MSIELHISAANAADLHAQLKALLGGVAIQPNLTGPLTAEEATTGTATVRGTRAGKGKAAAAVAADTAFAPSAEAETLPAAPHPPADPGKQRNEAVALLRAVYSKGEPGEKAVSAICAQFGVSKLVDVPLTKAMELLKSAQSAHVSVVGPLPAAA